MPSNYFSYISLAVNRTYVTSSKLYFVAIMQSLNVFNLQAEYIKKVFKKVTI